MLRHEPPGSSFSLADKESFEVFFTGPLRIHCAPVTQSASQVIGSPWRARLGSPRHVELPRL